MAGKPTVNRYLSLVRAILLCARDEWEWIDKTPKARLFKEGPGRERAITREQVVALLGELPTHQHDVVVFALATGLRQSNVLGLEWSRVELVAAHAWVCAELQRLGGWRSSVMVERNAHLTPEHLGKAASRLDSLPGGHDLATSEKAEG